MSLYRMYVKNAWTLNQRAVANFPLYAGQFGDDYLELHYSRFYSHDIPSNIDVGDWCGVYDQFGRVVYGGIIDEIDGEEIGVRAMLSVIDSDTLLDWNSAMTYTEQQLKTFFDSFFQTNGYHVLSVGNAMTVTADSSTQTADLRPASDLYTIQNAYNIVKEQIDAFGIYPYMTLPYAASNVLVSFRTTNKSKVTIANNASCILNPTIQEGDIPINTLLTKTNYNDGTYSLKCTILNTDGTYQDGFTPPINLALCFHKVIIKYADIKNGEEYTGFAQQQMPPLIYNHEITFDLLLDNNLYDFYSWELGMPMDIWIDGKYYDTILTGWETSFENDQAPSIVRITCGTSRTKLTEVLNNAAK